MISSRSRWLVNYQPPSLWSQPVEQWQWCHCDGLTMIYEVSVSLLAEPSVAITRASHWISTWWHSVILGQLDSSPRLTLLCNPNINKNAIIVTSIHLLSRILVYWHVANTFAERCHSRDPILWNVGCYRVLCLIRDRLFLRDGILLILIRASIVRRYHKNGNRWGRNIFYLKDKPIGDRYVCTWKCNIKVQFFF